MVDTYLQSVIDSDVAVVQAAENWGSQFQQAPSTVPYQTDVVVDPGNGQTYALTDYSIGRLRGWLRIFVRGNPPFALSNPDMSLPADIRPPAGYPPSNADWTTFDQTANQLGVGGLVAEQQKNATVTTSSNFIVGGLETLDAALPGWQYAADVISGGILTGPLLALTGTEAAAGAAVGAAPGAGVGSSIAETGPLAASAGPVGVSAEGGTPVAPAGSMQANLVQSLAQGIVNSGPAQAAGLSVAVATLAPLTLTLTDSIAQLTAEGKTLHQAVLGIAYQVLSGILLQLQLGAAFGAPVPGLSTLENILKTALADLQSNIAAGTPENSIALQPNTFEAAINAVLASMQQELDALAAQRNQPAPTLAPGTTTGGGLSTDEEIGIGVLAGVALLAASS
jgi:hypothetical protein